MVQTIQKVSIPTILEVGINTIERTPSILEKVGFSKIVLFVGENIHPIVDEILIKPLQNHPTIQLLEIYDFDSIDFTILSEKAFTLPASTQAILSVGGGKVLDCAKYIAFLNALPFIAIPTSTSHDGFASSGCSLYVNQRRKSVRATMPFGIIVDLNIIQMTPDKFIYSGLGDIVSKITAVYDWYFEEEHGYTKVNDFAVMMAKKSVNSIVRMNVDHIKELFFLKEMVDSLTMSGVAMEIAGSSSPASGSEHLISHALDKILVKPELHGIQVGVATYIMSLVQEHRFQRIEHFFVQTGFFDFVETLSLSRSDFEKAIDLAPTIKPERYTYLHEAHYREKAKALLVSNPYLQRILK